MPDTTDQDLVKQTNTLVVQCTTLLEQLAQQAIQQRGRFTIALCGGNSPKPLFTHWARTSKIPWSQAWLFWGDERCVPPHDSASNYRMVAENLLAHILPPQKPHIFRIHGERPAPSVAATHYSNLLKKILGPQGQLDVALLGIGTDGHTASLFPYQTPALEEQKLWAKATLKPQDIIHRITLTYPPLSRARHRIFFAPGKEKSAIIQKMLSSLPEPLKWPAQLLLLKPNTVIFKDDFSR